MKRRVDYGRAFGNMQLEKGCLRVAVKVDWMLLVGLLPRICCARSGDRHAHRPPQTSAKPEWKEGLPLRSDGWFLACSMVELSRT